MAPLLFSLARIDTLQGERRQAMDRLREAVAAGYANADAMSGDSALDSLHGPEFGTLVERARQNAAGRQAE